MKSDIVYAVILVYIYIYIYMYTNPYAQAEYDRNPILKCSLTSLNTEFSFS